MTCECDLESVPTKEEHERQIEGIVNRIEHTWRWRNNGEEEQ